jgi:hypothetical protein
MPLQFLNAHTTYATFQQDARVIDPAGFTARPKEPLGAAVFALALPSPAFLPARLEATRPMLRAGGTRVMPMIPGVTFQDRSQDATDVPPPPAPPRPTEPPIVLTNPGSDDPATMSGPPVGPPGPPMDVIYPPPIFTGIVVLNPPEHPDYSRRNQNGQGGNQPAQQGNKRQPPTQPAGQLPPLSPPSQPSATTTSSNSTTPSSPPAPVSPPTPKIRPPFEVPLPASPREVPRSQPQPHREPPREAKVESKVEPKVEPKVDPKVEPKSTPDVKSVPAAPTAPSIPRGDTTTTQTRKQ